MMANGNNTVIYTGVTNDLKRVEDAILREKQIKGGSRAKKITLINSLNPEWKDLYEEL